MEARGVYAVLHIIKEIGYCSWGGGVGRGDWGGVDCLACTMDCWTLGLDCSHWEVGSKAMDYPHEEWPVAHV